MEYLCTTFYTDDCGDPGTPTNGNTMGTLVGPPDALILNTSLGAVVNHSCIDGYRLQGAVERECLPGGTWSAPLPDCIGKIIIHK